MPSPPTPLPTLGEGRGKYKKSSSPQNWGVRGAIGRGERKIEKTWIKLINSYHDQEIKNIYI
jgi:hypothetical protein